MIEVRDIHKNFGDFRALRGVSFSAARGQVVGLLGPNGAGKTTTIRVITGFLPPSAGQVLVDGLDSVDQTRAVRARIGYMPESTPLYGEMRVCDYLHHRGRLFGLPRARRRAAVDRSIDRCWLRDVRRRRIAHLSKGYRQRVGLASALLHDPPVLILDEPTAGLDPSQIVETRRLIRELGADKTMIVSSHILPEVELTCDRVVIIARGRVRAAGAIEDLVQPLHDAARYVVEARPRNAAGAADVAGAFERAPQVAAVHREPGPDDGWARLAITPWPDAPDLRETLALAAQSAGLLVRELRRDVPTLESLFVRLLSRAHMEEEEEEGRS